MEGGRQQNDEHVIKGERPGTSSELGRKQALQGKEAALVLSIQWASSKESRMHSQDPD